MAPTWFSRPLFEGDTGKAVLIVQRKLGLLPTGVYGPETTLTVRGFQKGCRIPVTGAVDELTARELGEQEGFGQLPYWWEPDGIGPEHDRFGYCLDLIGATDVAGLKRFQGNNHLPPTGVVDETTARLLAGMEVESWATTLPPRPTGETLPSGSCGPSCRRRSPSCCSTPGA